MEIMRLKKNWEHSENLLMLLLTHNVVLDDCRFNDLSEKNLLRRQS